MSAAGVARALGTVTYAVLVVGALVAPAVAFDAATVRGGAPRSSGDLALTGAVVGVPYAVFLARRLSRPGRAAVDVWLSAGHGLIVLWLAGSGLPAAALHLTAGLHARVIDAEGPLLIGWGATLAGAVLLGEGTRRSSLRWLQRPASPS